VPVCVCMCVCVCVCECRTSKLTYTACGGGGIVRPCNWVGTDPVFATTTVAFGYASACAAGVIVPYGPFELAGTRYGPCRR
jgi:hypothetical protein